MSSPRGSSAASIPRPQRRLSTWTGLDGPPTRRRSSARGASSSRRSRTWPRPAGRQRLRLRPAWGGRARATDM